MCLVSPHLDDNYIGNAEHFRDTLAANRTTPDFWGVLNNGICQYGNWIGNEDDFATQFGVARHIFLVPGPTVKMRKKNHLGYALDGGVGAGNLRLLNLLFIGQHQDNSPTGALDLSGQDLTISHIELIEAISISEISS